MSEEDIKYQMLSGLWPHPPCRAPGCSHTPVAALSAVSSVSQGCRGGVAGVSQGCRSYTPPPPRALSHPIPDTPVTLILALGSRASRKTLLQ